MTTHLLFVDDEPNVLSALARICRNGLDPSLGAVRVTTMQAPYGALEFARLRRVDAVISDYRMPEMNGATLLAQIRSIQPDAARLLLSASADFEGIMKAVNDAAIFRYVAKPWQETQLKRTISEAIAEARKAAEDRRLADEVRARDGSLSQEELALRLLEAESPGITRVDRSEDGGVLLVP